MGYCYSGGSLVCDVCNMTGAKKRACPFKWCQPIAACDKCFKEKREHFTTAKHREHGCERNHKEMVARDNERAELLAAGKLLRCSAVSVDRQWVKVWFESKTGRDNIRYMSHAAYDAFPLLQNVSVEEFAAFGEVVESVPVMAE